MPMAAGPARRYPGAGAGAQSGGGGGAGRGGAGRWRRRCHGNARTAMAARPGLGLGLVLGLGLGLGSLLAAATEPRVYLGSWAVRVAAGHREAARLARRHGLLCLGQVGDPSTVPPRDPRLVPTAPVVVWCWGVSAAGLVEAGARLGWV